MCQVDNDLLLAKDVNNEMQRLVGKMEVFRDLMIEINSDDHSVPDLVAYLDQKQRETSERTDELQAINETLKRKYS